VANIVLWGAFMVPIACSGQETGMANSSATALASTPSTQRSVVPTPSPSSDVSWTDKAQAYSSILTLIVTVIGFSFVFFQIHQAQRSLNGSTHAAIYSQQHAINQLFVDHPELRKHFYENVPCRPADPNHEILLPVSDMVADFFEHLMQQRKNLPETIWPAWERYMKYVYVNSPVLREHFVNNGSWYDDEFVAVMTSDQPHFHSQ